MLELDLGQLERNGKVRIDESVPADDAMWQATELPLTGAVHVALSAQRAGHDVVVRGTIAARLAYECRRCLAPIDRPIDEDVAFVFRAGVDREEAERQGVYGLPVRTRTLDLGEPVREHVLLAAPAFATCVETCRGLCPQCGANLNEGACGCAEEAVDERWAALRNVKLD